MFGTDVVLDADGDFFRFFHNLGSLLSHLCTNSLKLQYFECSSEPEIEGPGAPKPPIVSGAVPASSSKEQEAIKTCT